MIRRYGTELRAAMMLADIAVTVMLAVLLYNGMLTTLERGFWPDYLPDPVYALALFVSAWVTILWLHGAYRFRTRWTITSDARLILNAIIWFALLTFAFLYLAKMPDVSRLYIVVLLALMLATTILIRVAMRMALSHCSHSRGLCGSWSACSSRPRQSGHRPCCACSSRSVVVPTGGLWRRRRVPQ